MAKPIPSRDVVVLRHILERNAAVAPNSPCVVFEDGEPWTFADAVSEGRKAASTMNAHGVGRGDRVLIFLPNGPDWLRAWFGTAFIGAVIVPVNTANRGASLRHICSDASAALIVTDRDRVDRLREAQVDLQVLEVDDFVSTTEFQDPAAPLEPWDIAAIMYTSGTTGVSKGVVSPYYQAYCNATLWADRMIPNDRVLIDLPMFHIGGIYPSTAAWSRGGSIALVESFSSSRYLDRVRQLGVTQTLLVGTMSAVLAQAKNRPDDSESSWRSVMCAPLPPDISGFAERFGLEDIWTCFGMTEISAPLISVAGELANAGVGRLRPGYEVRLVDEHDNEVPAGSPGQMIVRHEHPWSMNVGYFGRPEATAEAWRNGWFHTGDTFVRDEAGSYFFVDRLKDAIRRRGENISSFEVERYVSEHHAVLATAAVAAPGDLGDEEVKVFVVPVDHDAFDPVELVEFLRPRMPYFMIPRFIELIEELPTSANARVQKAKLREIGNSTNTWDREAAGIRISRE